MMLLTFRSGIIYTHGGELLAVEVERRPYIKARLNRLECTTFKQDGDDFGAFLFHVGDFEQVAATVKPYGRPTLLDLMLATGVQF